MSECIECGKQCPGDTWEPGQVCLFGTLFACSEDCAKKWALAIAAEAVPRIMAAAVLHNGVVYTLPRPARHHDVLRYMTTLGMRQDGTTEQGFVTDAGDFVRRKPALIIAEKAGQFRREQRPGSYQGPELFSEDLW